MRRRASGGSWNATSAGCAFVDDDGIRWQRRADGKAKPFGCDFARRHVRARMLRRRGDGRDAKPLNERVERRVDILMSASEQMKTRAFGRKLARAAWVGEKADRFTGADPNHMPVLGKLDHGAFREVRNALHVCSALAALDARQECIAKQSRIRVPRDAIKFVERISDSRWMTQQQRDISFVPLKKLGDSFDVLARHFASCLGRERRGGPRRLVPRAVGWQHQRRDLTWRRQGRLHSPRGILGNIDG